MIAHLDGQLLHGSAVEPDARFIEKPDRPLDGGKPREIEAPLLSCRQYACGKVGKRQKPKGLKTRLHLAAAEKRSPECEILGNRQSCAQGQPMPDEMRLLADGQIVRAAAERQTALARPQQTRDEPEQACFARAVASLQQYELAC